MTRRLAALVCLAILPQLGSLLFPPTAHGSTARAFAFDAAPQGIEWGAWSVELAVVALLGATTLALAGRRPKGAPEVVFTEWKAAGVAVANLARSRGCHTR